MGAARRWWVAAWRACVGREVTGVVVVPGGGGGCRPPPVARPVEAAHWHEYSADALTCGTLLQVASYGYSSGKVLAEAAASSGAPACSSRRPPASFATNGLPDVRTDESAPAQRERRKAAEEAEA